MGEVADKRMDVSEEISCPEKGIQSYTETLRFPYSFKGAGKRKNYFEGWYLKFMVGDNMTVSLITSIHKSDDRLTGNLQIIISDGDHIKAMDYQYEEHEVRINDNPFELVLGSSVFNEEVVEVNIDEFYLHAEPLKLLEYTDDVMGPFRFFSNLPCNHGLCVIDGKVELKMISGSENTESEASFYMEKDWGVTFPEKYTWAQCSFPEDKASFFLSMALVPLKSRMVSLTFPGMISVLLYKGKTYSFATYKLSYVKTGEMDGVVEITLANPDIFVHARIKPGATVKLSSPREGMMEDFIEESLSSEIHLGIKRKGEDIESLYSDRCAFENDGWFKGE